MIYLISEANCRSYDKHNAKKNTTGQNIAL